MAHPAYAIALTHVMTQHITFSWRGHRSHTRHGTAYHFFMVLYGICYRLHTLFSTHFIPLYHGTACMPTTSLSLKFLWYGIIH